MYVMFSRGSTVADVVQSVTVIVEVTVSWVQLVVVSHRLLKNGTHGVLEVETRPVVSSVICEPSRCFKGCLRL